MKNKILVLIFFVITTVSMGQHQTVLALLNESSVVSADVNASTMYDKVIAWYDFEESSGNLLDKSINNHDGINTGVSYQYGSEDAYYYGIEDYSTVADDDDLTQTGAFAIAVIFETPLYFDNYYGIAGKGDEFRIVSPSVSNFEFRIHDNGTTSYMKAETPTLTASTEYKIVFNYNGNGSSDGIKIYVNGGSDSATDRFGTDKTIINTTNDFIVGSANAGLNGLNGAIKQIVYFKDSLTDLEIDEWNNDGEKYYYEDLFLPQDTIPVDTTPDPEPIDGNYFHSGDYFVNNTGTGDTLTYAQLQDSLSAGVWGAGDTILIKANDDYYGALNINSSGTSGNPFVLGAYGEGTRPVIYGSEVVTGTWSNYSGNIYSISYSGTITQMFEDGVKLKSARYPNTGYVPLTSVSSSSNVTANTFPKE